ncbi:right-handed parallel beta-helix repeat-containing protein [Paenibacillus allorhizosphaerae]|uniref:Pectate lyase superfamily protein domain-containing protein n=1 Tax=Paenibacillus allorhizosphaerae TaxID=2849866 RepID=A0ABM8VQ33_9BACL|nr:right-handed parallel beta-helix repeat-containing protein [Paenibacillus allorhizosphaerae]CAG7653484.1 hypothetical protein PAECIP111802_05496 [Paenibacillus allorhizosphaerae]
MDNQKTTEKNGITRRKMLTALGAAGATLVAGGLLGAVPPGVTAQSVTQSVYGGNNGTSSGIALYNVKDFGAAGDGTADDTAAIQAALDYAYAQGGGTVYVPGGIYPITATLSIFARTKLELANDASIRRNSSNVKPMLTNGRKGQNTGPGYDGHGDIEIAGGTWDGNSANFPTQFPHMSFAHAKNLVIRDTKIINNVNDHHIEVNSTNGCRILNVWFQGYLRTSREAEAIQIDLSTQSAFPHFGPWDNTTCKNVLVDGCTFIDCCRGVGSHSVVDGYNHSNIRIANCHFENMSDNAIFAWNYDNLLVSGNTFQDCVSGIDISSRAGEVHNVIVSGNILRKINPKSDWGAIRVYTPVSVATAGGRVHNIAITGNIIEDVSGVVGIHANQISRITISDNTVRNIGMSATGKGIYVGSCMEGAVVSGNHVTQCTERGIAVVQSQGPVNIVGNVVAAAKSHGIHSDSCQNVVCTDNAVTDTGKDGVGNGIYFLNTHRSQMADNIITNSAENNINMKNSNDCNINNNTLTGAPLKISDGNQRHYVGGNIVRRGDKSMADGVIVASSSSSIALLANDLRLSGTSGAINDSGSETIKSGNLTDTGIV